MPLFNFDPKIGRERREAYRKRKAAEGLARSNEELAQQQRYASHLERQKLLAQGWTEDQCGNLLAPGQESFVVTSDGFKPIAARMSAGIPKGQNGKVKPGGDRVETVKASAPLKPRWEIPNLPTRLRKFAETMIALNCRAGTDTLREPLGFDPSRIFHDYRKACWKSWIKVHVEKVDTGVYVFKPNASAPKISSKSLRKRNVKVSK